MRLRKSKWMISSTLFSHLSDPIDDYGIVDAECELQSPKGVTMHCQMPGSSESCMSVGVPDPAERATLDAMTTSHAGKKKKLLLVRRECELS